MPSNPSIPSSGESPPQNARELAFDVLCRGPQPGLYAAQQIERACSQAQLAVIERRLAHELVHGVIRRQATLDALLRPNVARPLAALEPPLRCLLQLGAYQLALLSGVPVHAAVHETVNVAKRRGHPRWAGFVNGVLRSLSRMLTAETSPQPAACAVPIGLGVYRVLKSAVFADPAHDPLGYVASAFSLPRWVVERWRLRFDVAEIIRIGFWFNAVGPLTLRCNRLRIDRDQLLAACAGAGIAVRPGARSEAVTIGQHARIEDLPGFAAGWFAVQDESAMSAAALLAPQPGERVLDLCAAPGGKTTHLAELMLNQGSILATDVSAERLARVAESAARLGLDIIEPRLVARDGSDIPLGPFDAVLVDAPCSNTGVLGKRPEARWRLKRADFQELPELQRRLVEAAADRLVCGGRLVYSTCSIDDAENERVVLAVLAARPQLELVESRGHIPGQPGDGGYQALLRHKG